MRPPSKVYVTIILVKVLMKNDPECIQGRKWWLGVYSPLRIFYKCVAFF
jgi:hypothetical protein